MIPSKTIFLVGILVAGIALIAIGVITTRFAYRCRLEGEELARRAGFPFPKLQVCNPFGGELFGIFCVLLGLLLSAFGIQIMTNLFH